MFERLTVRTLYGRKFKGLPPYVNKPDKNKLLSEAAARLAAYEDGGLSPEEVQELKVSVKICEDCWNHAQAKAEGRLVKRGKWIYEHEWKCSSCGWAQSHDFNTIPNDILKYCPNCGAKMSKEEAEKALQEGLKC